MSRKRRIIQRGQWFYVQYKFLFFWSSFCTIVDTERTIEKLPIRFDDYDKAVKFIESDLADNDKPVVVRVWE